MNVSRVMDSVVNDPKVTHNAVNIKNEFKINVTYRKFEAKYYCKENIMVYDYHAINSC